MAHLPIRFGTDGVRGPAGQWPICADGARAIVLELDTPGGLAFDTRDFITDQLAKLKLPVVSWVEREALSAGALRKS